MIVSKNAQHGCWGNKPLGELVEFLDSKRVPLKESDRAKRRGSIPYYGANGQVDWIDDYLFNEPLVLLAEDGGFFGSKERPIAYKIEGKSWVNNHAHVLRPKPEIDIDYLHWILSYYDIIPFLSGSTRFKLTKSDASRIPVSYPLDIKEQIRIAGTLNKTHVLKQKRKEANQIPNRILQAVFMQMFEPYLGKENDWTKKLEAVCEKVIDIEHKMPKSVENGVPFISAKDISGDEIDFEHCKYIAQEDHERLCRRCNPKIGDILYSRIGVKLGIGRLVKVNKDFNISYSLCMIRPNSQIVNARYLTYFLNSELGRSQAKKETQSIAVPDLGMKAIKDFRIVVPPIELQNDFANICSKVESLKEKQRTCTEETSELFNSLMSKAFKGELVS